MSKSKNSSEKKIDSEDKGTLGKMNDSSAAKEQEEKTGTAEDEGTLGKMNREAEKK